MIESPKKRFLKTPHAKKLADITLDPAVIAGLDASVLQMQWDSGTAKTADVASALHWQLTGAQRLIDVFLDISIPQKPLPKPPTDNLPHEI